MQRSVTVIVCYSPLFAENLQTSVDSHKHLLNSRFGSECQQRVHRKPCFSCICFCSLSFVTERLKSPKIEEEELQNDDERLPFESTREFSK